jgi:hypothetical protein
MNEPTDLRRAFQKPLAVLVRVTPKGFLIDGNPLDTIEGRVVKRHLVRKLFQDGALVCDSPDFTTARDGTACDTCLHPRCQPQLRIHVAQGNLRYVLDLAVTSANNFFRLEDETRRKGEDIEDAVLRLTVENQGYWGEVRFDRV